MGGQYVTAASKVAIVGWLLCATVNRSPVGWFTQMVLYDDCYALCLPCLSLGRRTRLYLHAVCTGNFLLSAEDANRVKGRYQVYFPLVGGLE